MQTDAPFRLHVGGKQPKEGWKILNIQPGQHVDYLGSCTDMASIPDNCVSEIYASHVLEHMSYRLELPTVLANFLRVLVPGGTLSVSVPDLDTLVDIYRDPKASSKERWLAISMIFGGQQNEFDIHKAGMCFEFLKIWLERAGFCDVKKAGQFDYFDDSSKTVLMGRHISLNVTAKKSDTR